jgi:excinuclease ABC subunit C
MNKSAEALRFEEAARIRDRIAAVTRTLEVQNVSFFHLKDQDAVALVNAAPDLYAVQFLAFRKGKLLSEESFVFRNPALDDEEVMASSIKQYYGSAALVPKEIFLSRQIENPDVIETWLSELRGGKVTVRVPVRGQAASLVRLALKNAANALNRETSHSASARVLERLASKLHLAGPLSLIEGYDISNVAGSEPVGVKVAFRDGMPEKSLYRKYRMRGFQDQDDPGMIHQTLTRRLGHGVEDPLPDLILVDGGKSQLNAAVAALNGQERCSTPSVASIAKGGADGEPDKIYLPNRKNPVSFPRGDPGLLLLMRVRDEAHRFVHAFHQKSRRNAVLKSALDDVPGVGPKKRNALLKAFGSVKRLLAASDDDIAATPGITRKDVEAIRGRVTESSPKDAPYS